jgi:hypothetical protein
LSPRFGNWADPPRAGLILISALDSAFAFAFRLGILLIVDRQDGDPSTQQTAQFERHHGSPVCPAYACLGGEA